MLQKLMLALMAVLFVGCVSTTNTPIDSVAINKNPPKNFTATKRDKPSFAAQTAGKAAFAMIGAVAMNSAGNKIIAENNVDDPADYIAEKLSEKVSAKYQINTVNSDAVVKATDASAIASAYPDVDWVLDVQTINWSFVYFPTDWSHYRVLYSAKLRLIDVRNQSVLADGFCKRVPEKTGNEPTYDELLANEAEKLKSELMLAAEHCVKEFSANVLSL